MIKKAVKSLIVAVLALGTLPVAMANTCESVFKDESTVSDVTLSTRAQGAQRFLRLMQGKLLARYRTNPEVVQLAHEIVAADASKTPQEIRVEWPDAIVLVKKSYRSGLVSFTIPSLILKSNGVGLNLGARPQGLNSHFSKVLVSLMEAARIEVQQRPEIAHVEMVAGSVVNMPLIELLKQSGFIQMGNHNVTGHNPSRRSLPDMYAHQTAGGPFLMGMGMGGGMDSMFNSWTPANSDAGKNWVLRFEVNR